MSTDWKARGAAKRQAILDSIPAKWKIDKVPTAQEQKDVTGSYMQQFLTQKEVDITETDAFGIAKHVAAGTWSAVEVTEAFCHRASLAHQLVSCLHETFFDAAIADAKALDAYFAEHKKPIGPLHGVPVSLKDQFHVKDVETTMGYIGWIGTFEGKAGDPRKGVFESEMVRELRNLGAVLFCKTSVPHTLMTGETVNNIIGYTYNPKNRELCSGGSSGGEGALIGARGSPLGLGTDIGGSIRIPAAFNGLYGIRPSSGRLPYEGMANSMDGQNSILSVVGPIATSARSLKFAFQALLSQSPHLYDPMVIDMPWRSSEEEAVHSIINSTSGKGKLSFGLFKSDGRVNPNPPVSRAIDLTVAVLRNAGHEIIEWNPPSHDTFFQFVLDIFALDRGYDVYSALGLSGEPAAKQVEIIMGTGYPGSEASATEIAAINVAKRKAQKIYLDYWNSTAEKTATGRPVDGIITAIAPYPAARPTRFLFYGYSAWVNGLDYTSIVVPVTQADKNIDKYPEGYKPISKEDQGVVDDYDAEIYDGAHVSVQIVGRRLQEEKMLTIAEYVGGLLEQEKGKAKKATL